MARCVSGKTKYCSIVTEDPLNTFPCLLRAGRVTFYCNVVPQARLFHLLLVCCYTPRSPVVLVSYAVRGLVSKSYYWPLFCS